MSILKIFTSNFWKFDFIIAIFFILNLYKFFTLKKITNTIYGHFNSSDRTSNLSESAQQKLQKSTKEEKMLTARELLDMREKMNKKYSVFTNLTAMFPLFGMLGTVWALIQMVSKFGVSDYSNFFSALTSTFWGIVAALICKFFDSLISYKIEDNEKHMEHLIFSDDHTKTEEEN